MIGRLNHVAIAVPNLRNAINVYKNIFRARVSKPLRLKEHGVTTAFVSLPNTNIELLEPLGKESPVEKFINNNKLGGIHHICYEVGSIKESIDILLKNNYRILGNGIPRIGAHGKEVIFLHPKDFHGTLIELEQK